MDLTVQIVIFCVLIWLAAKFILFYLQAKNEILKEELDDLTKKLKDKIIHVNVEKHGSVFYLFEKETNRFIAQGSTINEIKDRCADRFKNSVIVADSDELKQYGLDN
jgi:hypothetical protein